VFVRSERRHLDDERDAIGVTIELKKSGAGAVRLHDAQLQFLPVGGFSTTIPLIGCSAEARRPRQSVLDSAIGRVPFPFNAK
jgi:hypothetical protein